MDFSDKLAASDLIQLSLCVTGIDDDERHWRSRIVLSSCGLFWDRQNIWNLLFNRLLSIVNPLVLFSAADAFDPVRVRLFTLSKGTIFFVWPVWWSSHLVWGYNVPELHSGLHRFEHFKGYFHFKLGCCRLVYCFGPLCVKCEFECLCDLNSDLIIYI